MFLGAFVWYCEVLVDKGVNGDFKHLRAGRGSEGDSRIGLYGLMGVVAVWRASPGLLDAPLFWIPACAWMTLVRAEVDVGRPSAPPLWIPAFAGMTDGAFGNDEGGLVVLGV